MSFSDNERKESFTNLHVYLHNLGRTDNHSYMNIKINVMDCFQLCFAAIGCCPFKSGLPTYNVHRVVMNGNNHIVPIPFSLSMANKIHYFTWFSMMLKEALRDAREVSFINNMNDVITSSLAKSVKLHVRSRVGRNRTSEAPF
uniref:Uncharacterized protein n=1 Tax=Lactuca sativa TaxID=4236 RepID=A0A9R1XHS3_LACSA|nr:hypothetical protein LSAT_V11C500297520 [Lactuca sativa]